jgi:hypothetical protein
MPRCQENSTRAATSQVWGRCAWSQGRTGGRSVCYRVANWGRTGEPRPCPPTTPDRPLANSLHPGPASDGRERGEGVRGHWGREVEFKEPGLYAHIVCLLIRRAATLQGEVSSKERPRSRRLLRPLTGEVGLRTPYPQQEGEEGLPPAVESSNFRACSHPSPTAFSSRLRPSSGF